MPESTVSWDESFEHSFQKSGDDLPAAEPTATPGVGPDKPEGKYHTIEEIIPKRIKTKADMLLFSERGENKQLKAVFGSFAGLGIGGLLYAMLVCSFGYTHLQAGIIVAISTIIFCICLALSSLCRCIMALLLPNFFTGKGRAVILSVIFGVMLAGPVANIRNNSKESGHSMACIIDLVSRQAQALQRQMAEPVKHMAEYIERQKQELDTVVQTLDKTLAKVNTQLDEIDKTVATASSTLNDIYRVCLYVLSPLLFSAISIFIQWSHFTK